MERRFYVRRCAWISGALLRRLYTLRTPCPGCRPTAVGVQGVEADVGNTGSCRQCCHQAAQVLGARSRRAWTALLTATLCAAAAGNAWAQHRTYNLSAAVPAAEVEQLEAQRRELFQKILANPADVDTGFAYAVLSTRVGDYEAAIGTYERLLVQHPGTPRLQLELAALYFRLGAYPQARMLFEAVLARADTPDTVRMKVRGYLDVIDAGKRQRSGFSGRLMLGSRWESNANAAPDVNSISLNGMDFLLAPESRAASDLSGQLGVNLRYRHLLSRHGDRLEVSLGGSGNRYRELGRLDSQVLELRAGPDVSLSRVGLRDARLSLSVVAGQMWLQGARYMHSDGLALAYRQPMGREASLAVSLDYRDERYTPPAAQASAAEFSGQRYRAGVSYTRQQATDWQWMLGSGVERRKARADYNAYWEPRLNAAVSHRFAAPLGAGRQPWTLALTGQLARRHSDGPMPVVNRHERQKGHELMLQLVQTIPLRDSTELQLFAGYRDVDSNYQIRNYSNRFVGFSVSQNF